MLTVNFAEFEISNYFTVENVQRSILPPREVNLLEVPGRPGAYYQGSRYGVREITIDIIVKASTNVDLMNTMRFLAYCLDVDRPTELSLSDEPNRVYYAILSDNSDFEEIMSIGKGSLKFLCPDPYAYSYNLKTVTASNGLMTFDNQGTAPVFPTFSTYFTSDASFVSYTSPDGVILIGTPSDAEKTKVKAKTTMLNDPMTSTSNWSNAGAILDTGRVNLGSIAIIGDAMYADNYGSNTAGWHGPGFRRTLSTPVQDFTVKTRLALSSQDGTSSLDGNQRGRIEIYLFSASGTKIGKLIMRDSTTMYEFNIPEILIGNTTFLESEPHSPGGKKVYQKEYTYHTTTKTETVESIIKKYKISLASFRSLNGFGSGVTLKTTYPKGTKLKVASKRVGKMVYPETVGSWNDFFGEFTLSRVGRKWYAEVSRMDGNLKKTKTIKKTFVDNGGKFTNLPVAYVVVSFLQWKAEPVCQKMHISDVKVYRHNTLTDTESPTIFEKDDFLEVNLEESTVHLNGDLFMNELDIGSTFFSIEEGMTEVKVNSDDPGAVHSADYFEKFI